MIIDNTYFIDEIYLPNAKPGITNSIKSVDANLVRLINERTRECLIKCLGFALFSEFAAVLDNTSPDGLLPATAQKWDDLLNGVSYTDPSGNNVVWRGIRQATNGEVYDRSFLADYCFYWYEKNDFIKRSNIGSNRPIAKNASDAKPTIAVTSAWNRFVAIAQGEQNVPDIISNRFGLGIDWFSGGFEISMYQYIKDINTITPDTYANFTPKSWTKTNQLGI